jgi:hypothetical protein
LGQITKAAVAGGFLVHHENASPHYQLGVTYIGISRVVLLIKIIVKERNERHDEF